MLYFRNSNDRLEIVQHVRNLNAYDQLDLDIEVRGTLPRLAAGAQVTYRDADIEYIHASPGSITSRGRLEATSNDEEYIIEVDQQVQFVMPDQHFFESY